MVMAQGGGQLFKKKGSFLHFIFCACEMSMLLPPRKFIRKLFVIAIAGGAGAGAAVNWMMLLLKSEPSAGFEKTYLLK